MKDYIWTIEYRIYDSPLWGRATFLFGTNKFPTRAAAREERQKYLTAFKKLNLTPFPTRIVKYVAEK